ncbi:MAG: acetate--CoA ligase family protein [Alphaproteobacteria bacterium]|nr:acetate--CoA ligase family protein [Alphaproteobacteria bacterium]
MIRLLEHEGKALLAKHGIAVPDGALFPRLPPQGPFMVKAQVLAGGRGKAGGIRAAADAGAVAREAAAVASLSIGGERVRGVYVERRLEVARELYLAVQVDRDRGQVVVLVCAEGGADVESVAQDRIARLPVDPLNGLQAHTVAAAARALAGGRPEEAAIADVVRRAYATLMVEDADLVEINPLVVTSGGEVIAADAKVTLDEDAAFRHPGRKAIPDGSAFEEAARRLEVVGIELDGEICAMMNGAGMTMATLDQLTAMGGSVRGLVELHGAMAKGPEHLAEVIALMLTLKPDVLLFNVYFQFRNLVTVAEAIVLGLKRADPTTLPPVVVRMRGVRAAEATALLAPFDVFVTDDFHRACRRAVELSGRVVIRE